MATSFENTTISELSRGLQAGDFTAVELAEYFLEKLTVENENIHAYLEIYSDVIEQAKRADEMIENGKGTALTGIPMAIKDNILLKDRTASAASHILENYRAPYSSTAAQKLADQGVVFLGRTNMDEFAMGGSTENSAFGNTKNPAHTDYVPGGSSGGSAASVAAGLSVAALGSDTGGSIRQPASFTGLVGLKPTYGTVSRSGLMAMASSLDQIGPLSKNVADAKTVFEAISGHDPLDSTSLSDEAVQKGREKFSKKETYTIGVPEAFLDEGVDEDVIANFRESLEQLKAQGHEVKSIALPSVDYALSTYYIIMPAEVSSNLARYDGIKYGEKSAGETLSEFYEKTRGEGFGAEVRRRVMVGTYVLSAGYYDAYYYQAVSVRQKIIDEYEKAFENVDVIATPTSPTPAFKIGEKKDDPLAMYAQDRFTVPVNIAGLPAISLPSGFATRDDAQLPLGLHLTAPALAESYLFDLGAKFLEEDADNV